MPSLADYPLPTFASISTLSTWQLVGIGSLALLMAFIIQSIYTLYFDPLSHIPGPKFAALSHFWLFKESMMGTRMYTIHKMHDKYGSKVGRRISFWSNKSL